LRCPDTLLQVGLLPLLASGITGITYSVCRSVGPVQPPGAGNLEPAARQRHLPAGEELQASEMTTLEPELPT
jgi:hypothetical protein